MQEIFLGRQPILDRNQSLVAFELLFRTGRTANANVTDDMVATASVIVNAYGEMGIQSVLGQQRGFINVSAELLQSDLLYLLPKNQVVLELLESVEITSAVVQRCIELKKSGYQLALDDVVEINDGIKLLLPIVNVVKLDILQIAAQALPGIVNELKPWPVMLLAEKVDSPEQASQCIELGFHLFQGYYFARPQIISGKRADPAKLALLQLLTLIMGDSETTDIEQEFKHHPDLSYNLMRMVNSAASGLAQKINSIKHGIVVIGRKQLQRWVQLLLYTAGRPGTSMANALMQTVATRGKLMELIATVERPRDRDYQDHAFMAGILSLLDALLGITMQEIMTELSVADDVKSAVLERTGHLGRKLALIEANEKNDIVGVRRILGELGFLTLGKLITSQLEAMSWAAKVAEPAC